MSEQPVSKTTKLFFAQIPLERLSVADVLCEAAVKCNEMMQVDNAATGQLGEYRVTVILERIADTNPPERFANHPVWQRNWTVWEDKQTGELMRSCVDARDNDRVYVGPLRSIHDPGIMSKADFEARYGDSARKGKK